MNESTRRITLFGLLTALALVLGWMDRAIPLASILGGTIPGIRLGLANTVVLCAVYLMDLPYAILLAGVKIVLSGFLFGSLSAMLYSLAGGALSLAVMAAMKRRPRLALRVGEGLAAAGEIALLAAHPRPAGTILAAMILTAAAIAGCEALDWAIRKGILSGVAGTSVAGAVFHNVGQVLMAAAVLQTPRLLTAYLPLLAGIGAAVGLMTGIVTERTLRALRIQAVFPTMHKDSKRGA